MAEFPVRIEAMSRFRTEKEQQTILAAIASGEVDIAIGTHRQKRAKGLTTSSLDEVPGIGPSRKRALLMHFGTARAVRNAALEDLERAPGISSTIARQVYDHFHPAG